MDEKKTSTRRKSSEAEAEEVSSSEMQEALLAMRLVKMMKSADTAEDSLSVTRPRSAEETVSAPKEEKGMEFDLKSVMFALLRRWWLIVVCTVLGAGIAIAATLLTYTPTYSATGKMYVNNAASTSTDDGEKISQSDLTASLYLVDTYSEILKTHLTLDEVIRQVNEEYGYEMDYKTLMKELQCGSVNETEVFYIKVTDPDQVCAARVVNKIIDVLPQKIQDVLDGSSVKTVDKAVEVERVGSGVVSKTFIGAFAGFALACAYAFLVGCVLNDVIDTDNWLKENYANLPILAEIPNANQHHSGKRYGRYGYGHYGHYGHYAYASEYDTDADKEQTKEEK